MKHLIQVILILCATTACADPLDECFYPSVDSGEIENHPHCGSLDKDGVLKLSKAHLASIGFEENGLQCIRLPGKKVYYVNREGKTIETMFIDNGCDYFKERLARTMVDGHVAYFDEHLDVILATQFDYGTPFEYGYAIVCRGAVDERASGEHSAKEAGQCGMINQGGQLVLEAQYSLQDRQVFLDYANSHNECEPPPIETESDLVCHAKRHAKQMAHISSEWVWYDTGQENGAWRLRFIPQDDETSIYTVVVGQDAAQLISVTSDNVHEKGVEPVK